MSDFTLFLHGYTMEYFDDQHLYLVNGVVLPSITQLLQKKFNDTYRNVDPVVLQRASERGTALHEQIETYCKTGVMDNREVRNFSFLQKHYGFDVLRNELPVILFDQDEPVACGRVDLVLKMDGQVGLADIKRTATLNKEYLLYQLNLYRVAFQQSYEQEITFLRGIHLRDDTRKFVKIPIRDIVKEII